MAYSFLEVIFVLINVYICVGTDGMGKRGLVNPAFEDINVSSHVISEIISDGVVNCMMLCSEKDDCRSVSHNKLDSRCRLFSQDFTGQATSGQNEIGWIHFDLTSDCFGVQSQGHTSSGLYTITIGGNQVPVWCDLETEGGGWTVFQRRSDGSVDFDRDWNDYVAGFGDPTSEYWIGNDALSVLTSSGSYELLILMETWAGVWKRARYSDFKVSNGTDKYRLLAQGYSGTAGHCLGINTGKQFSTRDQDNDSWSWRCNPFYYSGGWWFGACTYANLNGIYYSYAKKSTHSCHWFYMEGNARSLRTVFMMARKKL